MSEEQKSSVVSNEPGREIFQRLDTCQGFPYTKSEYIRRFAWAIIQKTLFRFSFRRAYRFRRFLLKLFGANIAATCTIRPTINVVHPWLLEMGEYSSLGDHVNVYNLGKITIGDHSTVSQHVHLCAGTHDYKDPGLPLIRSTIEIGSGVWICTDAFIGPGVKVGNNAIVAARGVLVNNAPADMIVAGNPAKVIKSRF